MQYVHMRSIHPQNILFKTHLFTEFMCYPSLTWGWYLPFMCFLALWTQPTHAFLMFMVIWIFSWADAKNTFFGVSFCFQVNSFTVVGLWFPILFLFVPLASVSSIVSCNSRFFVFQLFPFVRCICSYILAAYILMLFLFCCRSSSAPFTLHTTAIPVA